MRLGIRHPSRIVPLGFFALICIGTGLLMLPAARAGADAAPLLTAVFTATSAVCVTGLVVVDTSTYWSPFGQWVILGLLQVGGLGIMTGATVLGLLVAGRLGLATRLAAQGERNVVDLGDVRQVLRMVVLVTLVAEAATTAALALRLRYGHGMPWDQALWDGLFHAVSAFNNAGFSTRPDSLAGWAGDAFVIVPITVVALLGGLGFPVLLELLRRRLDWRRWSVHTRLTLYGSGLLIAGGTALILACEWRNPATFGALDDAERVLGAMFHSVAARTVGFSTVDMGSMRPETQAVNWALMFIGGGSGGTAGGIKITTFMLLGYAVWAEVRGSDDTVVGHRRIPAQSLRLALAVVLMALTVLAFGVLALLTATDGIPADALIFEAISASATVGLSTGITGGLPPAAQAILIVLMFVGRVGSVTLVTALALRRRPPAFRYPEERPIVG